MGNTKNAVIYARYSSHGQNEQSIEQQFEVCEKYAKQNGYTVVGHYSDEAKTGTNDNRPDFRRMITDSSSGSFQYVIIYGRKSFQIRPTEPKALSAMYCCFKNIT